MRTLPPDWDQRSTIHPNEVKNFFAADEQLLREALKALKRGAVVIGIAAAQIAPEYRGAHNVYDEGVAEAVATITKLEERLLSE